MDMANYKNKLVRHKIYNSVFVDITFDVKFVKDGFEYLKAAFEDKKHRATCNIMIKEYNSDTNSFDTIFEGIGNFSEYQQTDITASISFDSTDILQKFYAREKNKYNLASKTSTDGVTVPTINGEKITLLPEFNFKAASKYNTLINCSKTGSSGAGDPFGWSMGCGNTSQRITTYEYNDIIDGVVDGNTDVIWETEEPSEVKISGKLHLHAKGYIGYRGSTSSSVGDEVAVEYRINASMTATQNAPGSFCSLTGNEQVGYTDQGTKTFPFEHEQDYPFVFGGEQTEIKLSASVTVRCLTSHNFQGNCELLGKTDFSDTYYEIYIEKKGGRIESEKVKIWYPFEGMSKQLALMTSQTDTTKLLDSELLRRTNSAPVTYPSNGLWSGLSFASGESLYHGAPKISFRDLFRSINAIEPIGLWYDRALEKFKLEKIDEFYQNTEIISLNSVSNFKTSIPTDMLYTTLKGGYKSETSTDIMSGSLDPSCFVDYSTTLQNVKKTLDIQVPLRADVTGINIIRLKRKHNDLENDNALMSKIFFMNMKSGDMPYLGSDMYATGAIFDPDTWFNLLITPKRNLERQMKIVLPFLIGGLTSSDKVRYI